MAFLDDGGGSGPGLPADQAGAAFRQGERDTTNASGSRGGFELLNIDGSGRWAPPPRVRKPGGRYTGREADQAFREWAMADMRAQQMAAQHAMQMEQARARRQREEASARRRNKRGGGMLGFAGMDELDGLEGPPGPALPETFINQDMGVNGLAPVERDFRKDERAWTNRNDPSQTTKTEAKFRQEERYYTNRDSEIDKHLLRMIEYEKGVGEFPGAKSTSPAADGDMGTTSTNLGIGIASDLAFPWLLVRDPKTGKVTSEKAASLFLRLNSDAINDPAKAGDLMYTMSVLRIYGANGEDYVRQRLYEEKDPKTGKLHKVLKGNWSDQDRAAVKNLIIMMSHAQQGKAEQAYADVQGDTADPRLGKMIPDFETLASTIARQYLARDSTGQLADGSSPKSSGGGGGRRYGGGGGFGGGGGGTGATRYTDPEQLKSFADSIARQRMGRTLTPEEAQEFIKYYNGLEEQMSAQYYAGASNTQLDPESRAVAWIESKFRNEAAANQYGGFFAALVKAAQSGVFSLSESEG